MRLLLDANILYPSTLRDLFLTLCLQGKFELYWSERIVQEWIRSIKPTLHPSQKIALDKIIQELRVKYSSSWISDEVGSIVTTQLRDKDDAHVIAAAVNAQADYLITFNTRDFPNSLLKKFNTRVIHPDRFLSDRMLTDPNEILEGINLMCDEPRYQKFDSEQITSLLKNRGLLRTARIISSL